MDSYKRNSRYVTVSDGTKLAVDLYLPDREEKVPLLLKAGYAPRREVYEQERDAIHRFLEAGYAVAILEVRGSGASFGTNDGFFGLRDGEDIREVCDALAGEPWCSKKAGMYGGSNYGMSQELALVREPDTLYAAAPCDCSMDIYDQNYPNGVSSVAKPERLRTDSVVMAGEPVDGDPAPDYPMAQAAVRMHEANLPFLAQYLPNMYRDSVHPELGYRPNLDIPAWEKRERIRFGKAVVWNMGAWFDPGCTNKILSYKCWGGKLILGPWMHTGIYQKSCEYPKGSIDWVEEHIHFFDAFLKGKEDPYKEEPPVRYYTITPEGGEWRYEADFPVEGTEFTPLYFGEGGRIREQAGESGAVEYEPRDDINIYGGRGRMDRNNRNDMTSCDERSVCFTSQPIPEKMEITGVPVMELYVTSDNRDGNFIACLEEVTQDGRSHFLCEGMIRASHARVHNDPVYRSLSLPYHRSFEEDRVELDTEKPLRLSFHLEALSRILEKGSRLRVSISCGGSGFGQPEGFRMDKARVRFHYGKDFPSAVILPVIRPAVTEFRDRERTVYIFRSAVYIKENGFFREFPCEQVYPQGGDATVYETREFTVRKRNCGAYAYAELTRGKETRSMAEELPVRFVFKGDRKCFPMHHDIPDWNVTGTVKEIYVATVPLMKGDRGAVNLQMGRTMDLWVTLLYPKEKREKYPCIVNIHGYGGDHHDFDPIAENMLIRGYAVASIDYRLSPPNVWPMPDDDARACIRYLKANAGELHLIKERFGIVGGSMGGYLAAMLAACNGRQDAEGRIGGCREENCKIRAAAVYFGFTDHMHFADDSVEIWPDRTDNVLQSDGPYAPLGCMIGHVGEGKGLGDVKRHWEDPDYRQLAERTLKFSPIHNISSESAPMCFVHGIYDCGIKVPMGQSVRMFRALSEKGVKAFLLCNNKEMFGEDEEIKNAVISFLCKRV